MPKKNKNKQFKKQAQKQGKKAPNPETRAKVATGFKTLISNDACVQAGRNLNWWIPVIIAVCSVVLSLVPSLTSRLSVKAGDSILGSSTYGLESSLVHFADDMEENDATLTITDGQLVATNWDAMKTSDTIRWYQYRDTASDKVTFEVFYNDSGLSDSNFINFIDNYQNPYTEGSRTDIVGRISTSSAESAVSSEATTSDESAATEETTSSEESSSSTTYAISNLIFGKSYFKLTVYDTTGSGQISYTGQYDRSEALVIPTYFKDGITSTLESDADAYVNYQIEKWKSFLNDSYETTKITSTWQILGIMAGVYVGLIILLGLVVFLVCRGKNNPNRVITFWQAQKIAYWAALSPALLSLIMGYIISSYAIFFFVLFYGLRVMWMSMKSLRPMYPTEK